MNQLWEQKWRSFRKTEPQSAPEYNKPKSIDEGGPLLRELTEFEYDKVAHVVGNVDADDLSFDNIFQGKKRIVIPFVAGPTGELNKIITYFDKAGYEIDWNNGLVGKEIETQRGKQMRKSKIGKFLNKAISVQKKFEALALTHSTAVGNAQALRKEETEEIKQNLIRQGEGGGSYRINQEARNIWFDNDRTPEYKVIQKTIDDFELKMDQLRRKINDEFGSFVSARELEAMLKFWNEKGDFYRQNPQAIQGEEGKYSLVITRAPIDVLRMSDFDDITSCHSPPNRGSPNGGGYYACAIAEANGHGPIVYVVENVDIPEDFDWEEDEVFTDDHRGVNGVEPISRLRVRKFVDPDKEISFAIPELRTYGRKFPNLGNAVNNFFRKSQPEIMANPPSDKLYKLERYGGSYSDNTDDNLFRRFFDNSIAYTGSANHLNDDEEEEYDDEEEADLEAEYEAECEGIDAQYNNHHTLEHAYASYEIEDYGDGVAVFMNGGMSIEIDEDEMINTLPDWRGQNELSKQIQGELDVSVNDINFQEFNGSLHVQLDAYTSNIYENTPSAYEDFLRYNVKELDDGYTQILATVRKVLVANKILAQNAFGSLTLDAEALDDIGDKYKHFDIEYHDGELTIDLKEESKIPIDVSLIVELNKELEGTPQNDDAKYNDSVLRAGRHSLKHFIKTLEADGFKHQVWSGIVRMIENAAKQIDLPGLENDVNNEVSIKMPFEDLSFSPAGRGITQNNITKPWIAYTDLTMTLTGLEENEDVIIAVKLIEYIDEHFERVAEFVNKEFNNFAKSVNDAINNVTSLFEKENMVNEVLKSIQPKTKKIVIGLQRKKTS